MSLRWVESDYQLWKIKFFGTLYKEGTRGDRVAFVIAEDVAEVISGIKDTHDEEPSVKSIKQVGTCIYGEES